jgi:UDP-glucose 4-epimerase
LTINVGSGNGTTVLELVAAFESVTGRRVNARISASRHGDLPGGYADCQRARELLRWHPQLSVHEAIRDGARWSAIRDSVLGSDA